MTNYMINIDVPAVREGSSNLVIFKRSETVGSDYVAMSLIPVSASASDFAPNYERVDIYWPAGAEFATNNMTIYALEDNVYDPGESFDIVLEHYMSGEFIEVARQAIQILEFDQDLGSPSLSSPSILGVSPGQTFVHDFDASDIDDAEGDGLSYSLVGGANIDIFKIDAQTGVLQLKTPLPQSNDASMEIEVAVSDDDGNIDTQLLEVSGFPTEKGVVYLSTGSGSIYTWNPNSDDVKLIGDTSVALTDLAIAPDGTLYGISKTDLYMINPSTAEAARVGSLEGSLFAGTDALTDAQGFDISTDGVARISSGDNSVVAVVDLESAVVTNPFGPSLRQTETSSGGLWFASEDRYFVSTNSNVLLTIAPSTFNEAIADNDFIGSNVIDGLVSLADTGGDQRSELIGFSGDAYYSLAEGEFALPGLEQGTLGLTGSITGAARLRVDEGPSKEAPGDGGDEEGSSVFNFFNLAIGEQVTAIYLGFFGRPADQGGKEFWSLEYQEGRDNDSNDVVVAREMSNGFRFSPEAQMLFPFLTPAVSSNASTSDINVFVDGVFDNLYNRTPEPEGSAFWVDTIQDRLANAQNIGDLIIDIMAGAQGSDVNTLMNKIEVANAYTDNVPSDEFDVREAVDLIGTVDDTSTSVTQAMNQI